MAISQEPEKCIIIEPPKHITERKFETVTRATPDELEQIDLHSAVAHLREAIGHLDSTVDALAGHAGPVSRQVTKAARDTRMRLECALLCALEELEG